VAKKTVTVTYVVKVDEARTKKEIVAAAKGEAFYVAESVSGDATNKAKVAVAIDE
jgi:hypothetical protein